MVTEEEIEDIRAGILLDLLKRRKIGKSHTSEDNITKGFPKSQKGIVKQVRDDLINEDFLSCKPTGYGRECSINPKKIKEIMNMPKIKETFKNDPFLQKRIMVYLGG